MLCSGILPYDRVLSLTLAEISARFEFVYFEFDKAYIDEIFIKAMLHHGAAL